MKLSIVIPVRNASHLLNTSLSKFYPLHVSLAEIIIVDCCSTDGIENVLKQHNNLPIIHLRGQDKGIYDAFNIGASAASSLIVYFMGADDIIQAELFDAVTEFPMDADVLVGKIIKDTTFEAWRPSFFGIRLLFRNIPHQGMIIKKDLLLREPYSLKYHILSDYAWNIAHFWRSGINYRYTPYIFCNWMPGGVSTVEKDFNFNADKKLLVNTHAPFHIKLIYNIYKKFITLVKNK